MTYTVTISYAGKGAACLETPSARAALEFYREPHAQWISTATIKRNGREIGADHLAQLAIYEEAERASL